MACVDPTSEPRVPTKDAKILGEGDLGFKPKSKGSQDRNLTFRERIEELAKSLKLCKAAATDLLDGYKMESMIYAPCIARQTKIENQINNQKKQAALEKAKKLSESYPSSSEVSRKRSKPSPGDITDNAQNGFRPTTVNAKRSKF